MFDLASFFTGPAQVPMMSPNGSVPPIYVPPGYVSQAWILIQFPFYNVSEGCVTHISVVFTLLSIFSFVSSQIIEENGVRRVLVLPQQPEFHPGGHSPLHHPPPPPHAHLPAFIPHPAMMPPPPHMYTGMAGGVGDMSSQYISQYHPAHIYSEQGELDPALLYEGDIYLFSALFAHPSLSVKTWVKLLSLFYVLNPWELTSQPRSIFICMFPPW